MKLLTHIQVNELFMWYRSQHNLLQLTEGEGKERKHYIEDNDTWILNITLTLDNEKRRLLKDSDGGILRSYHRFLIKLANATNSHIFGWIGIEDDMVREHAHILALMRWEKNRRPEDPMNINIDKLWNNGKTDVKIWDGSKSALFYDYSYTYKYEKMGKVWDKQAHYHYVVPTTVYHPRRAKCRKGKCDVCKSFPQPSYFKV